MKKNTGIWIDHEKAILVFMQNRKEKIIRIKSDVEKQSRMLGGSRSKVAYAPMDVSDEHKVERRRHQQLRHFYQDVIKQIHDEEKIYIFGPGEAKVELEKQMKESTLFTSKIADVVPADKMTDEQVAAQVRNYFKS